MRLMSILFGALGAIVLAWPAFAAALVVVLRRAEPVRVRIERQLGYKMAKYLRRIE